MSFVSMMQSFHLKSSILQVPDQNYVLYLNIDSPRATVGHGRNLPNVLLNPSPGLSQHLKYPD